MHVIQYTGTLEQQQTFNFLALAKGKTVGTTMDQKQAHDDRTNLKTCEAVVINGF